MAVGKTTVAAVYAVKVAAIVAAEVGAVQDTMVVSVAALIGPLAKPIQFMHPATPAVVE